MNFRHIDDLTTDELTTVLNRAGTIKADYEESGACDLLDG
ncbi:ornithine carbamoyltransferase, partial [Halobacteriales archaeon QH_8_67_27]